MKGHAIAYSDAELVFIQSVADWPRDKALQAFSQKFARDDVSQQNFNALCKRKGWLTGRTGCFAKGQKPHNKGKRCPDGVGGRHPNARKTQFKKGARTGIAQKNYKPIGYERITEDGYRERKVNDDLPFKDRWQLVQRIEWEKVNGPIPEGHALKCLDGNRRNCDPANWEAVPRAVLARLNGGRFRTTLAYDDAPAELKPLVMNIAKLKHRASEVRHG
ncbi:MAG: HNH endonuclease [Sphingomonas sp.]|nr:HNH endonuclease [Sphingomonas sp.]